MNCKLFHIALFSLVAWVCQGQRSSVSTMYMLNQYQQVQAYGGIDRSLSTTFMYRSQWAPIAGNPRHLHVNAHLPIYLLNGGAGILFEQEDLGVESNTTAKLSYNMVFRTELGIFSGGASLGIRQKRISGDEVLTPSGIYDGGQINHQDPILGSGASSQINPIWSLGLMWQYFNLTTGLQLDNFFTPAYEIDQIEYQEGLIVSFLADYQYNLSAELKLVPSVLVITNGKLMQAHVGVLANYGNIFGGINMRGISTNSVESLGIISGIKFNKHYTIAYGYDLGLSALKNSSEGSHEIIFKYNLNKIINTGLPPRIIYNPRDL